MTVAVPRSAAALADETRLRDALRLAGAMVAATRALAFELEIEGIDLPSVGPTSADRSRVQAVAPLYLAAELESARLLPALDLFARLWASGGIPADLGPMGPTVLRYHQERERRLTAEEREAIFGRLFGKPYGPDLALDGTRNVGFEPLFIEFASSITDWSANAGRWGSTAADLVRVRTAAQRLADNLAARTGGVATFAAGELLEDVKVAVAVFKDVLVQRALGAPSMWQAVSAVVRRFLQQDVDISSHVERARAGVALLAWLVDALPLLEAGTAAEPGDDVVASAIQWMQATLALHERGQASTPPFAAG